MNKVLEIKNFSLDFLSGNRKCILNNINLTVNQGEIIALVGESGCGKTTLGRSIVDFFTLNGDLCEHTGQIHYFSSSNNKYSVFSEKYKNRFKVAPIQMIFNDTKTSLNLMMNTRKQLHESMFESNLFSSIISKFYNKSENENLLNIAKNYKLDSELLDKIPKNLSGGQRRRVGIAKIICALSREKSSRKVVIADEPVASLDASIKLDIMNRLLELQKDGYTIIIISHDISLVTRHADKIFIMSQCCELNGGTIIEEWNPKENKLPKTDEAKKLLKDSKDVNKYLKEIDSN